MAEKAQKKDSFSQSAFKKLSVGDKFKKVFNSFRNNGYFMSISRYGRFKEKII